MATDPRQHPAPGGPDADDREEMLKRDVLLVATAGLSLVNGMHFSPYFDPVFLLLKPFIAGTLISSPLVLLYLASIFVSLMTLLIGGIPAALFERARAQAESSSTSLAIWLATVLVVTIPSFMGLLATR